QGEQVSKKVIVRGKEPFQIIDIHCDDVDCFQFKASDTPAERQIVEIIFTANRAAGEVKQPIHIATDLGDAYIASLTAYATIVPREEVPLPTTADSPPADAGSASEAVNSTGRVVSQ